MIADGSEKVIPAISKGGDDNVTETQHSKTQTDPPKDFFTSDIKFIVTVVMGLLVIVILVYLIPRVSNRLITCALTSVGP